MLYIQIINWVIIILYPYSPHLEEIVRYLIQIFFLVFLEILTIILSHLEIISLIIKIFIMLFHSLTYFEIIELLNLL
mgnify:FL=1